MRGYVAATLIGILTIAYAVWTSNAIMGAIVGSTTGFYASQWIMASLGWSDNEMDN